MINLSKLLRGDAASFPGDRLRYGERGFGCPVVVWHLTGECNLKCRHCYAAAPDVDGMSLPDVALFLAHLSAIRPPALLFSGGEPLKHPRFFEYLVRARAHELNVAISTNGTLVDRAAAERIFAAGASYVGVSLDGVGAAHDGFRGEKGAFEAATAGIDNLLSAGCRVGLRVTLARPVLSQLQDIFALTEKLGVGRICFYHFMPSGRGAEDATLMPPREEERRALLEILDWTDRVTAKKDDPIEILTVGDASDGPFLYKHLAQSKRAKASRALALLKKAALRRIGAGIASVRWDGALFSDQFSWGERIGSWRDLPTKQSRGRNVACLECRWMDYCAGSLRMDKGHGCMLDEEERRGETVG